MAGKKRRAEPEEEEFSEDDSEFEEEEDGEGAPPGIVEEEDDDDELEAEMAALEAIQREKRGGAGGADKVRVNNKPGLLASLEDFGWTKKAAWIDHMVVTGAADVAPIADINDDLQRETSFYERALASAEVAISKLKALGIPTRRPDDFYAEMVKSDEHMKRVRAELIFEQTRQETTDERRKAREQKRYGKQVQAEKLKERTLQKKDSIKNLDKWRKQRKRDGFEDNGAAPEGFEDEKRRNKSSGGGGQHGRSTPESRQKKSFKEEKFGFGGRKRLKKQNDKESARDMTGYKPSNFDKGFREGKGWGDLGSGGRGGRGGGGRGGGGRGRR